MKDRNKNFKKEKRQNKKAITEIEARSNDGGQYLLDGVDNRQLSNEQLTPRAEAVRHLL